MMTGNDKTKTNNRDKCFGLPVTTYVHAKAKIKGSSVHIIAIKSEKW